MTTRCPTTIRRHRSARPSCRVRVRDALQNEVSMAKNLIRIAVLGLGRMGTIYLRTLAGMEGVRLSAADVDIASRTELLRSCGVGRSTERAEKLLMQEDVDAVVVATPTDTHARLVMESAAAGKAVFCEKPLALTLDETYACLRAVREAGTLLQVGFMRRFDPEYRRADEWIRAGRIGRPIVFHAIGRDRGCPPVEFADPASSGGLVLDMGIHDFDLARWLMRAEVVRVSAETSVTFCRELERVGDVDGAVINLRFDDDALGTVEVGRNGTYGYDVRTEVVGTEGAVRVGFVPPVKTRADANDGLGEDIRMGSSDSGHLPLDERVRGDDAESRSPQLLRADGADDPDYLVRRFGTAYRTQMVHFVHCLRTGRMPVVGGEDALRAFEIALAAARSAREGRPVEVEEVRSVRPPER